MKRRQVKLSSISLLTILSLLGACQPQNTVVLPPKTINSEKQINNTQVKGTVEFPEKSNGLSIKATTTDISTQSTVSIIYPPGHPTLANKTAASGLTDGSGTFIINPAGTFTPATNDTFVLEAAKRIGGVGQDDMTLRTYIKWNGTGWDSMTTPGIKINSKTTALAIIAGYNTGTITASDTINKIVNGTPQSVGSVTAQTITDVAALVTTLLTNNFDPVQYIGLSNGSYVILTPTLSPVGEFLVNTYTTNQQSGTSVAMDVLGDFIISWGSNQDENGVNFNYGVYAQRYNNAGAVKGAEFKANTFTTFHQLQPAVAMDSDGDYVITWFSGQYPTGTQDGDTWGVYAQRYNRNGVTQPCQTGAGCNATTGEFRVNTYTTNQQREPAIAMDSEGDFIISWQSIAQDGGNEYGVYARRYNRAGIAQGAEFLVNTFINGPQRWSSIAMDNAGDFVVTWNSYGQDGDKNGIYAQRFNTAGAVQIPSGCSAPTCNPATGEFRVNTYTTNHQQRPSVGMDADGNFVISWESAGQDGITAHYGVYARRYNAAGIAQSGEFLVNTYTTGTQRSASVAMDSNGDFVIAFANEAVGTINAQRYSSSGATQGSEITTTSGGTNPKVAMNSVGDFVISWKGTDGSSSGIKAQRYNAAGVPQ
jgi:hypothetical protein